MCVCVGVGVCERGCVLHVTRCQAGSLDAVVHQHWGEVCMLSKTTCFAPTLSLRVLGSIFSIYETTQKKATLSLLPNPHKSAPIFTTTGILRENVHQLLV